MYRKPTLFLFLLCALVAGASGIAQAQRSIAQAQDSPSISQENGKGSISGRVVKEDGEPAVGMVVDVVYGRRGAHPGMGVRTEFIETDKEGRFRVPDLLPGEYILNIQRPCCREGNSIPADEMNEAPYYKEEVTYYKDTPDRKDARSVWVKANIETASVDITLYRRPLHKVSGTIFNHDGQPLPGAKVVMIRKQKPDEPPHSRGVSTVTDAQGNWWLEVTDGVYLIETFIPKVTFVGGEKVSGYPAPPTVSPQLLPTFPVGNDSAQPRQVRVSGADMPNVVIDMNRHAQVVSGTVVLEDGSPIPPEVSVNVSLTSFWDSKVVAANGGFELKGPELGDQFLSAFIQPFGTYYVKSVTCDGTDYLREAFEFGNGVDYKGIQVVLSPRGSLLEGSLHVNRTSSPAGQVWLIPEDETKWRAPLTWFWSRISGDGTFSVYAAPGDYLIIAHAGVEREFGPYELNEAEDYVRKNAPTARHITLKAGERKSVAF